MNREKALIKNSIIIGIGTFMPKVISIVTLPIVTGYLTRSEYGTYDLLLTLVSLVLPFATLQIQSAAFRFLIEIREETDKCKDIISNIIFFTFVMSIIPIVIIFLLLEKYGIVMRIIICHYFIFDTIFQSLQQIARGLGKNRTYSLGIIINATLNMLMIVVFLKLYNLGLIGVVGALAISNTFTSIYLCLKLELHRYVGLRKIKKETIKKLITYSCPLIPNNLSSWVMTLSDRLLLVFFCGIEINAVYAIAKKIPNLLCAVQSTFSLAWQENASLSANDNDIDEYYSRMFDNVFNLVIGVSAFLIGSSPFVFSFLIKGNYDDARIQMPVLFLGMTFMTLSSYLAGIYIADKKTKEIGITTTIAAIINLSIDFLAIPYMGMWAASISTLVSYVFLFIFRIFDLKKYHRINYKIRKDIICIVLLSVVCFLSLIDKSIVNWCLFGLGVILVLYLNHALIKNIIFKLIRMPY